MTIMHWQPLRPRNSFGRLYSLQNRMNRMFDEMFSGRESEVPECDWSPRLDVIEVEGRLEIAVELPGVKKEDVKVELVDDVLILSGQKNATYDRQDRSLHLTERTYGAFRRSFQLPGHFDREKIEAQFDNGVLYISLPRIEKEKSREIQIVSH